MHNKRRHEAESAGMARALEEKPAPATDGPTFFQGVAGSLKNPEAAGFQFSYGVSGEPSAGYLDAIIEQLDEIGVEVRIKYDCEEAKLSGNTKDIPADLLSILRNVRPYLIARLLETRTVWLSIKGQDDAPPMPDPTRPVEWETWEGMGTGCGDAMPDGWIRWRYLYGSDRNVWRTHTGLAFICGTHAEPVFRRRYKPKHVREREEREAIERQQRSDRYRADSVAF